MRGAFRKPQGTVARVNIGQPIMSIRSSDKYKAAVIESLRWAKFKFPGRHVETMLKKSAALWDLITQRLGTIISTTMIKARQKT